MNLLFLIPCKQNTTITIKHITPRLELSGPGEDINEGFKPGGCWLGIVTAGTVAARRVD